ncbi:MAG: hypothetical protein JRJ58_12050 [Deltaproteobacteria bacterium]|nr:hypothetical protein [Deltaproteobacteria bacterium]
MSTQTELEIFERAVAARGRLLRVEADRSGPTPRQLALTFDVGRILVRSSADGLSATQLEERGELPGRLEPLDEQEPWWRLLGQPLTAVRPGATGEAVGAQGPGFLGVLKLRFREAAENPRIVVLEAAGAAVRVSLEH